MHESAPTPDKSPIHLERPFPLVLALENPGSSRIMGNYVDTLRSIRYYRDTIHMCCRCREQEVGLRFRNPGLRRVRVHFAFYLGTEKRYNMRPTGTYHAFSVIYHRLPLVVLMR